MINRQAVLEIDLDSFKRNVSNIKSYTSNKTIMPVIKANAYGTYINTNIDLIKDFEIVAVAMVSEAIKLRNIGYTNEIFVLNQPYIEDIPNIIEYNITIGISSFEFLYELKKYNNKIKVHLEIETGMGRTGINVKELPEFLNNIPGNIQIEGIYTHFSVADIDKEFTEKQILIFKEAINFCTKKGISFKHIHSSASSGILRFNDNVSNLVRPGIILYGYEPFEGAKNLIELNPIAKLKAKINYIKEVEAGTSISYGRKYIAPSNRIIATVGIGYADGIRRILSKNGEVVVNGKKAHIVGTICMDSFMIDVTDIEGATVGTEVYIWDNDIITLDEVAKKCDTINYEILSTISERIPREFIK